MKTFKSILQLMEQFNTDMKCRKYLESKVWKDGKPVCPHCAVIDDCYRFVDGRRFKCKACKKQFTVTVGTIFEGSHVELQKWFVAVYLLSAHKKGISSHQLARDLGITQKSAWYMLHRLRYAIRTKSFLAPLKNVVEIDETYVGGKDKFRHEDKKGMEKTVVFGMVERGGEVRSEIVKEASHKDLYPVIQKNVEAGSKLMTDDANIYYALAKVYKHQSVNHKIGEYVRDNVHTNTIENFWSLFKRGIIGIYHQVSPKHLDKYLDEFEFRYNSHKNTDANRFNSMLEQMDGYLSYKELIKEK